MFVQADDAVAAMSSPHRPPAAVVGVDHDHQELNMTSPPVNAKPPLAQVTCSSSPVAGIMCQTSDITEVLWLTRNVVVLKLCSLVRQSPQTPRERLSCVLLPVSH